MTSKQLTAMFDRLNKKWFDGRLHAKVAFADLSDVWSDGAFEDGRIEIDNPLKHIGDDLVEIVMLHEMVHAELSPEYQNAHGMRFQARIAELIRQGAYDTLL